MSDFIFGCPTCQRELRALAENAGEVVQCPHCSHPLRIPAEAFTSFEPANDPSPSVPPVIETSKPNPPAKPRTRPIASEQQQKEAPTVSADPAPARAPQSIEPPATSHSETKSPPPAASHSGENLVETKSPPARAPQNIESPATSHSETKSPPPAASHSGDNLVETIPAPAQRSIEHLLPPVFLASDPIRIRNRQQAEHTVVLPTAEGGLQTVDQRLVTVQYKGVKYTLVALTPAQKRRRQIIVNVVSIAIAILAILATIWVLVN